MFPPNEIASVFNLYPTLYGPIDTLSFLSNFTNDPPPKPNETVSGIRKFVLTPATDT